MLRVSVCSLRFPHQVQPGQKFGILGVIGADFAFVEEGAGWTDLDALAAASAGGFAPGLMEIGDDERVDAAPHDVPDMRAFNFSAYANAAGAEDAAILVEGEALV
jgi:hypothetical protein